jgi:hypothetical protein
MDFEIVCFENQDVYHKYSVSNDIIDTYIKQCVEYINPSDVNQDSTSISYGKMFFSYADRSGSDKPMLVMLIGSITSEMRIKIQDRLNTIYMKKCEMCDESIHITRALCRECANNN